MSFFLEDFRSKVLWGSAERLGHFVLLKDLCESEIGKADVPVFSHEDIFRLQISINDFLRVEMTESHGDSHSVHFGLILCELLLPPEMHEELTTSDKLHDEEDLLIGLEDVLHADQEWVIRLQKDLFLKHGGLDLIIVKNDVLSETLHGEDGIITDLLNQEDLTKTSFTNNTDNFEVLKVDFGLFLVFLEHSV
tara:strand:- start:687 stop:1265 length:579 start_codon:yes stop_codon:yes gene_type:complete